MQAVLLAAGLGSRLGSLTQQIPKALISVGGKPLLAYAVRSRARPAPGRSRSWAGSASTWWRRRWRAWPCRCTLIENRAFRDGNLISLVTARDRLRDADDFLLMNVDHIYRPAIAALAAAPADDVTAFVDTDRTLGADDMKVERDGAGRVLRISKTLEGWDAGYVGMTKVPRAAAARYWATVDAALAAEGRAIHVERVLARLADAGTPPLCRDISGHGWLEVDLPEERDRADEAVRGAAGRTEGDARRVTDAG